MMNRKTIMLTVLALASGFQNMHAMGGARDFARKVFLSKTAVAAGALAGVNFARLYFTKEKAKDELNAKPSGLSEEFERKAGAMLIHAGLGDAKLVSVDGVTGVPSNIPVMALHLHGSSYIGFSFMAKLFMPEPVLLSAMRHEMSHLKHNDHQEREVSGVLKHPLAIMAGKVTRVAGSSKKVAVATGVVTLFGATALEKAYNRSQEERADREAAVTRKDTQNLINYYQDAGERVDEFYARQGTSSFGREFLYRFIEDHPKHRDRVAYLKEILATLPEDPKELSPFLSDEDRYKLLRWKSILLLHTTCNDRENSSVSEAIFKQK